MRWQARHDPCLANTQSTKAHCSHRPSQHGKGPKPVWQERTQNEWNKEAYENLVITPEQKAVLTTLVEAQGSLPAAKVDDFVKGKGLGLVINLYGNPGTGKHFNIGLRISYSNNYSQGRV